MAKKKKKKAKSTKKASAKKSTKKVAKKAKGTTKKAVTKKGTKKTAKKTAKQATKKQATKKAAPAKTTTQKIATNTAKKPVVSPEMMQAAATSFSPEAHPMVGSLVPNLTLQNHLGETRDLGSYLSGSEKVVLYFYPKDDTPGCTTEACDFRDNLNRLETSGVKVLGVSPDGPESHQRFVEKYGINFELLSDPEHKLANALKVWKEKNFMGRTHMGVERTTFLLDGSGKILKAWQPVSVQGHVDEVIRNLD